jgi:hypothetical protein
LALTAWAAVGAVGPAARHAAASPTASPFAGVWSGTFTTLFGGFGTFDWTISESGRMHGTAYVGPLDDEGDVVGQFADDGGVHIVGLPPQPGFPPIVLTGEAYLDSDGSLHVIGDSIDTDEELYAVLDRTD